MSLIVGQCSWDVLPEAFRCALRCAAAAAERALLVRYDTLNPPALASLVESGVTLCRFPADVLAAMRTASANVLDTLAAGDPVFADALRSYRIFGVAGQDWWQLGERDAAAAAS